MLCMALMLLSGMPASAQKSYGISGKVTDQTGNGIAGASVIVKGTTTGTSTGSDGSYSLNVKDGNATLVCSFIGMKSAEASVNGRTEVNFTLEADAIGLEEVIAIGYGTIRKEEITSSITRVSSDEFLQGSVSNPLQLLQGKVAGLGISKTSGNPSGELSIMLRGISTLAASSAPLIVIDGVAGGSLNAISPEDIESIDVLKDGSAAAIYGTRGTNGVIIINTKRPQSGRVSLEYKGYVTIDRMLDETSDYPDAAELRSLKSRLAKEDSRFDLINDFKGDTDWVREITRTPVSQTHYVSLQGGNARTNYLASVTYNDKQGIYKGSFDESLTAKLSINHAMFDDRLKIALNVSNKIVTQGIVPDDLYMQALSRNPTIPVYNADGSYNWPGEGPRLVAYDFGIKWNILRLLTEQGFDVLVVPPSFTAEQVKASGAQAVFLSNGPGDPATLTDEIVTIKKLVESYPVAGICLGHQLLGHALGGTTRKLKFGHHGCNHPVKDLSTGHVEISSQNHGFCVDIDNISDVVVTHVNLNDGTLEGFAHKTKPILAVQHHPEACPGPIDSQYFFARFRGMVRDAVGF